MADNLQTVTGTVTLTPGTGSPTDDPIVNAKVTLTGTVYLPIIYQSVSGFVNFLSLQSSNADLATGQYGG
jgi:hypothetical protein